MVGTVENYIPVEVHVRLKRQAIKVWIGGSTVVLLWVALIVGAPVLAATGATGASAPIYKFFSYICHQLPYRSFFLDGHQLAVCSRCFGVYLGLLVGFLIYPLWRPIDDIEPLRRFWLFLSLIPIGVDWSLGFFGIWQNTFTSRFITGLILGVACAVYMVPALIEIARNLTRVGQVSRPADNVAGLEQ
jgi:uncharacterized membrane protein